MYKSLLILPVFAAVVFSGCRTVIPEESDKALRTTIESEQYREFGDRLLESIRKKDFSDYKKLMEAGGMQKVTPEDFNSSCQSIRDDFGVIKKFSFVTELKAPLVHNLIWKVEFERADKEGRKTENELLFQLVMGEKDRKIMILGMRFL